MIIPNTIVNPSNRTLMLKCPEPQSIESLINWVKEIKLTFGFLLQMFKY